jgi:hypothetical protein
LYCYLSLVFDCQEAAEKWFHDEKGLGGTIQKKARRIFKSLRMQRDGDPRWHRDRQRGVRPRVRASTDHVLFLGVIDLNEAVKSVGIEEKRNKGA